MKDIFPDYYSEQSEELRLNALAKSHLLSNSVELLESLGYPNADKIQDTFDNCIFAFDANALTHIYQMPEALSERYLTILEKYSDRLWLPHHAASEYHRNIIGAFKDACEPLSRIRTLSTNIEKLLLDADETTKMWHWYNEPFKNIRKELQTLVETATSERDNRFRKHDQIKERIATLFDGKVGPECTKEQAEQFNNDGNERVKKLRPPACKVDSEKNTNQHGDVIIWRQLLNFAKKSNRDIVFITDDIKNNWFLFDAANTVLGPRPELVLEARRVAKVLFWACTTIKFIEIGQEKLKLEKSAELNNFIALEEKAAKEAGASNRVSAPTFSTKETTPVEQRDLNAVWTELLEDLLKHSIPTYSLVAQFGSPLALRNNVLRIGVVKENHALLLNNKSMHLNNSLQRVLSPEARYDLELVPF